MNLRVQIRQQMSRWTSRSSRSCGSFLFSFISNSLLISNCFQGEDGFPGPDGIPGIDGKGGEDAKTETVSPTTLAALLLFFVMFCDLIITEDRSALFQLSSRASRTSRYFQNLTDT